IQQGASISLSLPFCVSLGDTFEHDDNSNDWQEPRHLLQITFKSLYTEMITNCLAIFLLSLVSIFFLTDIAVNFTGSSTFLLLHFLDLFLFFDMLIKPSTDNMFKGIYNVKQCHLQDISAVLGRAWSAGIDRIIVTGGSLEESKEALAIAETDGLLLGFSAPWVCTRQDAMWEFDGSGDPEGHFQALLSLAKEGVEKGKEAFSPDCSSSSRSNMQIRDVIRKDTVKPVCMEDFMSAEKLPTRFSDEDMKLASLVMAIGECGLDYDRLHFCPSEIRKRYFKRQFELAYAKKLPMFCTCKQQLKISVTFWSKIRRRYAEHIICIMCCGVDGHVETYFYVSPLTFFPWFSVGVAHSFTGSEEERDRLLSFKYLFLGANLVKQNNISLLEIGSVKSWRQVLEVVAGCKGITDITPLSKTLYHNTCRVFFPHDLDSAADALLAGSQNTL
ncbi:hypothetical protein RJ639_039507, partial [Escallonia herrerae]